MRRFLLFGGLLCVLMAAYGTADAHHPLGQVHFAYEFGDAEVPTLDGDLSDWDMVPESYKITMDNLHDYFQDMQRGDTGIVDSTDFTVWFKVGWNESANQLYIAAETYDNMHLITRGDGDLGNMWQQDCMEVEVDGDNSGGQYENFGSDEENQRWGGAQAQQYAFAHPNGDGVDGVVFASGSTWPLQAPYGGMGFSFDGNITRYEVAITPWNDLHPAGSDSSTAHIMDAGQIVGLNLNFADFDNPGNPGEYNSYWMVTDHHDNHWALAQRFADFLLMPQAGLTALGTVSGTVTNAYNGAPIPGATVQLFKAGEGLNRTSVRENGTYSLWSPPDTYDLVGSAEGFDSSTLSGVTVAAGSDLGSQALTLADTTGPEIWGAHVDPIYTSGGDSVRLWTQVYDHSGVASATAEVQTLDGTTVDSVPLVSEDWTNGDGSQGFSAWWTIPDMWEDFHVDIVAVDNVGKVQTQDNAYWFTSGRGYTALAYRGTPDAVDGDPHDWAWEQVPWIHADLWQDNGGWSIDPIDAWDPKVTKGFRFKVLYDDERIYFLTEETDDVYAPYPDARHDPWGIWQGDCVQMAFETNNSEEWGYTDHTWEFGWTAGGFNEVTTHAWYGNWLFDQTGMRYGADPETGEAKVTFEIAIWHPEEIRVGDVWGFSAMADENDGSGYGHDRPGWVEWAMGIGLHKDVSTFGDLVFTDQEPPMGAWIPNVLAASGDTVSVPIMIDYVHPDQEIISVDASVGYDATAGFILYDVDSSGTIEGKLDTALVSGWQIVINDTTVNGPNWREVKIGMTAVADSTDTNALDGEGPLVFVRFIVPSEVRYVQSHLELQWMRFNEGPDVLTRGGDFTVARYGDASGNDEVTPTDATWMLWDAVELIDLSVPGRVPQPYSAGGDSIDILEHAHELSNVSGRMGITSYDAGLLLQYVVGLITRFPVEKDLMRVTKPVFTERMLQLVDVGDAAALMIDEMSDVVSGDIEFSFDPSNARIIGVEKSDLTDAYMLFSNVTEGRLRISFAGAVPVEGSGEIARIRFDPVEGREAIFELRDVQLNEGMIPVRYVSMDEVPQTPRVYRLSQNYPNPFNPETAISFDLPEQSIVGLRIYNAVGQQIRTLMDGSREAGAYTVVWEGRDDLGLDVASGIYFYRLKAGDFQKTRKMLLVR